MHSYCVPGYHLTPIHAVHPVRRVEYHKCVSSYIYMYLKIGTFLRNCTC